MASETAAPLKIDLGGKKDGRNTCYQRKAWIREWRHADLNFGDQAFSSSVVRCGSGLLAGAGLCPYADALEASAASLPMETSIQCGGVVHATISELESAEGGTDTPVRNPNGAAANPSKESGETEAFTPDQTFAYDAAGNRKEITRDGMTTTYQANAVNQYAQIATGTEVVEPVYDELGNCPSPADAGSRPAGWLRMEDAARAAKQLLEDDRNTYTWDADIHLMSVTRKAGGLPASRREGDSPSQAAGVAASSPQAEGESPSATTTHFRYDPLHRRLARITESETTIFAYDGWSRAEGSEARQTTGGNRLGRQPRVSVGSERVNNTVIAENTAISDPPQQSARLVWGEDLSGTLQGAGGIGGLLSSRLTPEKDQHPTTHLFHYDSNGNVILLTSAADATPTARYAYDAFGQTLTATGPAAHLNRYQFSTKPIERGSGLAYYGYRYYDPVTGRWPSRDPMGEMGGVYSYSFVNNSITGTIDVLGMWFEWCPIIGTLEQLARTYLDDYPGMKAGDYAGVAENQSDPEMCALEIDTEAMWFFIKYVTPNGSRLAIDYAIIACFPTPPTLAGSAKVTLIVLGLSVWASEKISSAPNQAKIDYCGGCGATLLPPTVPLL